MNYKFNVGDRLREKCPVGCGIVRAIDIDTAQPLTLEELKDDKLTTFIIKKRYILHIDHEDRDGVITEIDEDAIMYDVVFGDGLKRTIGEEALGSCVLIGQLQ